MTLPRLDLERLLAEAAVFCAEQSGRAEKSLYGVTDGKAVGTYIEHRFKLHLGARYQLDSGNSAKGIDFPSLDVDIKVTSARQPQSSCPFNSARQKVYGLGYHLVVFVYDKFDDARRKSAQLRLLHAIFIDRLRTADFQTTRRLREILDADGNRDDLIAFMHDRNLPVDEVGAMELAEELLVRRPEQGYLTISNALQWRLQYGRVIDEAGLVDGIRRVR